MIRRAKKGVHTRVKQAQTYCLQHTLHTHCPQNNKDPIESHTNGQYVHFMKYHKSIACYCVQIYTEVEKNVESST